jgi:hypothetical protein
MTNTVPTLSPLINTRYTAHTRTECEARQECIRLNRTRHAQYRQDVAAYEAALNHEAMKTAAQAVTFQAGDIVDGWKIVVVTLVGQTGEHLSKAIADGGCCGQVFVTKPNGTTGHMASIRPDGTLTKPRKI